MARFLCCIRQVALTLDAWLGIFFSIGKVQDTPENILILRFYPASAINIMFYNIVTTHQSPGYDTPDEVYLPTSGGGARIVAKLSATEKLTQK